MYFQRLCEELEYTELVDKAADIDDPFERMVSYNALLYVQIRWHQIDNLFNGFPTPFLSSLNNKNK